MNHEYCWIDTTDPPHLAKSCSPIWLIRVYKERIEIIKKLYKQVFELNELSLYLIMPNEMQRQYQLNKEELFQQSIMLSHKLQMYLLNSSVKL